MAVFSLCYLQFTSKFTSCMAQQPSKVKLQHMLYIGNVFFNILMCSWPDGAVRPGGNMQRDGDGDGTLSTQGGHGSLRLTLIPRGFDPRAAQVGQLVELDTVLLQHWGADWGWTCASQCWTYLNWTTFHYERGIKSHREPYQHKCAGRAITECERTAEDVGRGFIFQPARSNYANRKLNNRSKSWNTADSFLIYINISSESIQHERQHWIYDWFYILKHY